MTHPSFQSIETALRELAEALPVTIPENVVVVTWDLQPKYPAGEQLSVVVQVLNRHQEYPFDRAAFIYARRNPQSPWTPVNMNAVFDH